MTNEQYSVWLPTMAESEKDCRLIKAYDAEEAAKLRVKNSYYEEEFDGVMTANVRGPYGELTSWEITPEPIVNFYSCEVEIEEDATLDSQP